MEHPHIVIITIVALLLTILHSYQQPNFVTSQTNCGPLNNLCVACPHITNHTQIYTLNKYVRVSHHSQFHALATFNYRIAKKQCKDMLKLISKNEKGSWTLAEQTVGEFKNKSFMFDSAEEVSVAAGKEYHLILSGAEDYLIFYEGSDPRYPQVYVENEANPEKLMKLSRSISWGMLFALLLKYFDCKLGIFNIAKPFPLPVIEVLTLVYILYISYELQTFSFLYVSQLMFLTYLVFSLAKEVNNLKIFCFFILFFILGQSFIFAADIIWLLYMKVTNPNLLKSGLKLKIITIIVIISLITNVLLVISKFNYLVYLNYAYKIISIPVSFLLFQVEEAAEQKPTSKLVNLSRYVEQSASE